MMSSSKVHIVGWAHSKFGRLTDQSLEDLIIEVGKQALVDAELSAKDIDAVFIGNFNGGLTHRLNY